MALYLLFLSGGEMFRQRIYEFFCHNLVHYQFYAIFVGVRMEDKPERLLILLSGCFTIIISKVNIYMVHALKVV
jgi:hypothetical protein